MYITNRFPGICYNKRQNRYLGCIQIDKQKFYFGSFKTELDAVLAYNRLVTERQLNRRLYEVPEDLQS